MTKKVIPFKRKDHEATKPSSEDLLAAEHFIKSLPPDIAEEIRDLARNAKSEEDFCKQLFIGDCPSCESINTADCDADGSIEDSLVGRCLDCDTLWCLECSTILKKGQMVCKHWEICDSCETTCDSEDEDDAEWCGVLTWECDKIIAWKQQQDKKKK